MSTFTHSQPIRPRFESAPYKPSPARREHIYGRIQPMDKPGFGDGIWLIYGLIAALVWLVILAYLGAL